jgi:chromosome segregation ATPase
LRNDNRELSERRFQNEKTITELSCKVESLRSELEDKKTIITSTVQLKETNNSQISSLEQLSNDQKKQLARLDQKVADLEGELSKLNATNSELQDKMSRQKEKLQERGEIIKEQEKELKDLKKTEAALERDTERLQYEKEERDNKIKALQDQLEKVQKKFEEEQAMVAYLQKNLNERPGLRSNYHPPTAYTPNPANSSYSAINRDLPSQLSTNSNTANSRTALTTSQQRPNDKYEPNIKRYEERSKSPVPSRLPQQKDPEDGEESYNERPTKFEKPYPVKFKMSQPKSEQ